MMKSFLSLSPIDSSFHPVCDIGGTAQSLLQHAILLFILIAIKEWGIDTIHPSVDSIIYTLKLSIYLL